MYNVRLPAFGTNCDQKAANNTGKLGGSMVRVRGGYNNALLCLWLTNFIAT